MSYSINGGEPVRYNDLPRPSEIKISGIDLRSIEPTGEVEVFVELGEELLHVKTLDCSQLPVKITVEDILAAHWRVVEASPA